MKVEYINATCITQRGDTSTLYICRRRMKEYIHLDKPTRSWILNSRIKIVP